MDALSLWEVIWQLGIMAAIATPIIIILGGVMFLIFKPIQALDNL